MSTEIERKNALRAAEAQAYLEKAQAALDEMELRSLRGMTREQMAELRTSVRQVKECLAESRKALKRLATRPSLDDAKASKA